jgi:uncharacterized protein
MGLDRFPVFENPLKGLLLLFHKLWSFTQRHSRSLMNLERARQYILDKLDSGLPADLSYHSATHTRDVVAASLRIGKQEGFTDEELTILETAALYHDSGFLFQYQNHEARGCVLVREVLPGFGYSSATVDLICDMIMATKIPQSPTSKLAEVLCDADLDYLGSESFYRIGGLLFKEFQHYGIIADEVAWNKMQVRFLEVHSYFTATAAHERQPGKRARLEEVKAIVAGYES